MFDRNPYIFLPHPDKVLTLIDKTGPYQLPTGWHEVTTRHYCDLDRLQLATVEARASYFAGRAIQVNGLVADALAFLLSEPPTQGGLPYPLDLGQETYLQVETIRELVAKQPLHQCYCQVYGTFTMRALTMPPGQPFMQNIAAIRAATAESDWITDTYPAFKHCLAELQRLTTKYAELSEPDPTEAGRRARDAGADELLGLFGHFNVAKALAERQGVTIDTIYQTSWETIAITLLHDRRQAILSDAMQKNSRQNVD